MSISRSMTPENKIKQARAKMEVCMKSNLWQIFSYQDDIFNFIQRVYLYERFPLVVAFDDLVEFDQRLCEAQELYREALQSYMDNKFKNKCKIHIGKITNYRKCLSGAIIQIKNSKSP